MMAGSSFFRAIVLFSMGAFSFGSGLTLASNKEDIFLDSNQGILSYRNYGVLANPGLEVGSSSGGVTYGFESVPGIKDPMSDARLRPQNLSFLAIPSQYVNGFSSKRKLDISSVAFTQGTMSYLPVLPSSAWAVQSIGHLTSRLVPSKITTVNTDVQSMRLESRSHIFVNSKNQALGISAKSTGAYEDMIGPGNPDDFKYFPPSLAIWGVLASDFFEERMKVRPASYQRQSPVELLPDRAVFWINTEAVPGFNEIPFQEVQKKRLAQNTAWSFRDLSGMKPDHLYVTEFVANHKIIGSAIALANGYDQPLDFWINAAVQPIARALVHTLLFSGAETFSLHGQNKTIELDDWMRPTGRMFLKDASDFIFRESTLSSLNIPFPELFKRHREQFPEMHADMQKKLVEASFHNAGFRQSDVLSSEVQARYAFISTTFENRGAFDWLFGEDHGQVRQAFLDAAISEISAITGVEQDRIKKIALVQNMEGYFNIFFDTQTDVWRDIANALKSPRPLRKGPTPYKAPTAFEMEAVDLLSRIERQSLVPTSQEFIKLAQLIDQDPQSVMRALAFHISRFRKIESKALKLILNRLAPSLTENQFRRLAQINSISDMQIQKILTQRRLHGLPRGVMKCSNLFRF